MRGVEELETAEFDERNVSPRELDLQRAAVARGSEQHGLLFQRHADLAVGQHLLDDVGGLVDLVLHCDEHGPLLGDPIGPEVFRVAFRASSMTPFAAARIGWVER